MQPVTPLQVTQFSEWVKDNCCCKGCGAPLVHNPAGSVQARPRTTTPALCNPATPPYRLPRCRV
jgi:hypothetical protein